MDEVLLSTAPSYSCSLSFPVLPSFLFRSFFLSLHFYCIFALFFVIICLTLSEEQVFFCYFALSFNIFFLLYSFCWFLFPHFSDTSDASKVMNHGKMRRYRITCWCASLLRDVSVWSQRKVEKASWNNLSGTRAFHLRELKYFCTHYRPTWIALHGRSF